MTTSTVRQLLNRKGRRVVTAHESMLLSDAAKLMTREGVGSLIVPGPYGADGIVTWHDVLGAVDTNGQDFASRTVGSVMTRDVISTTPEADLREVVRMMIREGVRHLPVYEAGRVVGMLSRLDALATLLGDVEELDRDLRTFLRWSSTNRG